MDLPAIENPEINRLENDIRLFERLWLNRWLKKVPFILALNKIDLVREKFEKRRAENEENEQRLPPPDLSDLGSKITKVLFLNKFRFETLIY